MVKITKLDKDRYMATQTGGARNSYFVVYEYGKTADEAKANLARRFEEFKEVVK